MTDKRNSKLAGEYTETLLLMTVLGDETASRDAKSELRRRAESKNFTCGFDSDEHMTLSGICRAY